MLLIYFFANKEYKKTTYYEITHHPFGAVRFNVGRYGEYLTYKYLRNYEQQGAKFLFNVYVPKSNGETSEIDVMMIHPKGIFVFESKNYSGWIFGSETQKMWTQTLPAGKGRSHKESFYNPIMQNKTHIKNLLAFLGETVPTNSVIVFSERCTLKKIQIDSEEIYVIKRNHLSKTVSKICGYVPTDLLNEVTINDIYNRLYPYTQVNNTIKEQHIENIRKSTSENANKKNPSEKQSSTEDVSPATVVAETDEEQNTNSSIQLKENPIVTNTDAAVDEKLTIGNLVSSETTETSAPVCPKCGGHMILRTATKGDNKGQQFYGCSNYPKCRYIQNISK